MTPTIAERLERAISKVLASLASRAMPSWHSLTDGELLRELATCALGSQVPFEMSLAAVRRLEREDLLMPLSKGSSRRWEARVEKVLALPLTADYRRAYRFPALAARRLGRLLTTIAVDGIRGLVASATSVREVRLACGDACCGLGPKQTSLFLRNIAWSADHAVLDVHVLAYMRMTGLAEGGPPTSLKAYEELEDRLRFFARGRGVILGQLDWAIWISMRTARQEGLV